MLDAVLSRRKALIAAALVALPAPALSCAQTGAGLRAFGLAATGTDADSVSSVSNTALQLGRKLEVVSVYEAFEWRRPLPTALFSSIAAAGAVPEITWEPWNPAAAPDAQPEYALAELAGGRHDGYVRDCATEAAGFGGEVLIRFGHEMNGQWYPWSVRTNGGTPTDYVAAFRRVHQIFVDAGANRVRWVWSPNVVINDDRDAITQSYPGDDVVDIVGVDGYNFGDDGEHSWRTPAELFGPTLDVVESVAPRKPLWINEVGSTDLGGSRITWFGDLVHYLKGTRVDGLVLFDLAKPGRDWRITGTPEGVDAARAALATW